MARQYGTRAAALLKTETTFGVAATGNYNKIPFKSADVGSAQGLIASDLIGVGRDPLTPGRDVIDVGGAMRVPVDLRNFGHWLRLLLGAPVTTGTGPYTHTFVSGAATLPSAETGIKVGSMAVEFSRAGNTAAALTLLGQKETRAAVTGGGTPVEAALTLFNQFQGSVKRNTVALGNITSATFNYTNNLDGVPAIRGDGLVDGVEAAVASCTGQVTARFADTVLLADAETAAELDLEFAYVIDASNKVTFTLHAAFLAKPRVPIEGPGGVQVTFDYQGARDTALSKMLTVVLVNDVVSYT
jgi:Phage tail tube protein